MDATSINYPKLQECISDGWKHISAELKNYYDTINLGKAHVSVILSHNVTLTNIELANIQETELFEIEPDIKLKLKYCIQEKIMSEEVLITKILKDLQKLYTNIRAHIDRIDNVVEKQSKTSDFSISEICKESITSVSIAEMLERFDAFKLFFTRSHNERKYSLDLLRCMDDPEKISSLWDASELLALKQEFDLVLAVD